jgi:hypothetical protein
MNMIRVLLLASTLLVALVFVTQVALPLWRGRMMWPWFRPEKKLLDELDEIRQQKEEKRLQEKVNKERLALNQKRKARK